MPTNVKDISEEKRLERFEKWAPALAHIAAAAMGKTPDEIGDPDEELAGFALWNGLVDPEIFFGLDEDKVRYALEGFYRGTCNAADIVVDERDPEERLEEMIEACNRAAKRRQLHRIRRDQSGDRWNALAQYIESQNDD